MWAVHLQDQSSLPGPEQGVCVQMMFVWGHCSETLRSKPPWICLWHCQQTVLSIQRGKNVIVVSLTFCSQFLAPKENPSEDTAAVFAEGGDVDDLVSAFNIYQVFSRSKWPEL